MEAIDIAVNARDRLTEELKLREALTAEIVADVEHEIGDVLTRALDGATDEDRKASTPEVIVQTRFVMDALTTEETQSECARQLEASWAVAVARHLRNLQMAQTKQG